MHQAMLKVLNCMNCIVPHNNHRCIILLFTFYICLCFLFGNMFLLSTYRLLQWLSSKESTYNTEYEVSIPGWGRFPGGVQGNPLTWSCLENPIDRGA